MRIDFQKLLRAQDLGLQLTDIITHYSGNVLAAKVSTFAAFINQCGTTLFMQIVCVNDADECSNAATLSSNLGQFDECALSFVASNMPTRLPMFP